MHFCRLWYTTVFPSRSSLSLFKACRVQVIAALSSKSCCNPVPGKRLRVVACKSVMACCQHSVIHEISKALWARGIALLEITDGFSFHKSSPFYSIIGSSLYLLHTFQNHISEAPFSMGALVNRASNLNFSILKHFRESIIQTKQAS